MTWREQLLKQWQQPAPTPASVLLRPLSWLYRAGVWGHRAMYTSGLRQAVRLPVPVIVVGNLVVGGAGKTPAVIAIAQLLRAQRWTPGVVSRGYGRSSDTVRVLAPDDSAAVVGDEPLLIQRRTSAPVAVGADRVAAARALCAAHPEVNLLIADDGLQHHRLARDVEVFVFDQRGAGNGLCLPAGLLRAPMPATPPPGALVLYSAGAVSTAWPGTIGTRRLAGVLPWANWSAGRVAPAGGLADTWSALRGRPVLAAAGLARPQAFFDMLSMHGLQVVPCPLPDHHAFDTLPWPADCADVVVTEKDAVKLDPTTFGATRVWVTALDFQLPAGFGPALGQCLPPPPVPIPKTPP